MIDILSRPQSAAAVLIFAATYLVLAIGRLPGFRIDRTGAAFLGAALMVAAGVLSLKQAMQAVDFDTIALLLGMMIVVANLRLSGFFRLVTALAVRRVNHPLTLLIVIVLVSGVLSAFLVNDTICLVLTPLVLDVVLKLERPAVPYLLATAMASNIGSVATITGNPQNIIIGSISGLSYSHFAGALAPVAATGLVLTVALIALVWRREFLTPARIAMPALPPVRAHAGMIVKTLLVTAALIAAFFLGVEPGKAAVVAGGVLLLTRRVKIEKMYAEVDWTLLLMFVGLFIVVAGFERSLLTPGVIRQVAAQHFDHPAVLSLITAALSNVVSNVPAVLVLRPFVSGLADPAHAWLVVAMAATLAGNFTLLGSVANLIVAQKARMRGVNLPFWDYFAVGAPLTVLTILIGVWLL
ncbi:MAG: anion transporter [Alphaproteobacteria bacterium]|nr:anion transporter [Alphaproteobacteria bacterium]MDE2498720.1 anion transporter [Alphaproteobacteria bacterium]